MALSIFTKYISIFSNTRNTNWNGNDIFGALLSMTIVRRLNVFDQNHQNLSCNFPASWRAARLILTLISYLFRMSVLSLRTLSSLECVLSLGSQFSAWCVFAATFRTHWATCSIANIHRRSHRCDAAQANVYQLRYKATEMPLCSLQCEISPLL